MRREFIAAVVVLFCLSLSLSAQPPQPTRTPRVQTLDLDVGETYEIELANGNKVPVKLLDLHEIRDELRNAVRRAEVTVLVAGQRGQKENGSALQPPRGLYGFRTCLALIRGYP